jgi:cytoskeleton-associated protein 5
MADEAAVLAEAAKLPIEERAAHSNWKVRSAAYEFIKLKCSSVFDPSDHCLSEFGRCLKQLLGALLYCSTCCCTVQRLAVLPLIRLFLPIPVHAYAYCCLLCSAVSVFPKASADGNAAALDKALEALQAFLEKASDSAASRIAGTVCSNIVSKSLGARPSTVAKGNDCLAAFVEVEQAEKVTVRVPACAVYAQHEQDQHDVK